MKTHQLKDSLTLVYRDNHNYRSIVPRAIPFLEEKFILDIISYPYNTSVEDVRKAVSQMNLRGIVFSDDTSGASSNSLDTVLYQTIQGEPYEYVENLKPSERLEIELRDTVNRMDSCYRVLKQMPGLDIQNVCIAVPCLADHTCKYFACENLVAELALQGIQEDSGEFFKKEWELARSKNAQDAKVLARRLGEHFSQIGVNVIFEPRIDENNNFHEVEDEQKRDPLRRIRGYMSSENKNTMLIIDHHLYYAIEKCLKEDMELYFDGVDGIPLVNPENLLPPGFSKDSKVILSDGKEYDHESLVGKRFVELLEKKINEKEQM